MGVEYFIECCFCASERVAEYDAPEKIRINRISIKLTVLLDLHIPHFKLSTKETNIRISSIIKSSIAIISRFDYWQLANGNQFVIDPTS